MRQYANVDNPAYNSQEPFAVEAVEEYRTMRVL